VAFDFDKLNAPISDDAPCGPDLRDDPAFRDIEDAPGEFASQTTGDLRKVVNRCIEFLEKTKDQTPAIVAVQASVRAADFDVANSALQLIKSFAENYWEDFHPGPAEEMAIGRVNELTALARPAAMTLPLQRAGLARMPAPSTVEFNAAMLTLAAAPVLEWTSDNESALGAKIESGAMTAIAAKTMKTTHDGARVLRAVMRTIAPEAQAADRAAGAGEGDSADAGQATALAAILRKQVAATAAPLKAMCDVLYDITAIYDGHSVDSPSFGPVIAVLKSIDSAIEGFLTAFPDPDEAPAASEEAAESPGEVVSGGAPRAQAFSSGTPQSRVDVDAAIEAICRFYAQNEPSSPVPLMLRRVQTWIHKDFIDLIREIAPNAADEVTKLLAIPNG
jgi:type VI secretion system protein ImpA